MDNIPSPISIALTEDQHLALANLKTADKAVSIVCALLRAKYGENAKIEEDREGVDLIVSIDGRTERIEVKGTEKPDIAWSQLKVSSQQSHDALASGDASIYRVVDVCSVNPRIYVLEHGKHFRLEHEPRWAVKRAKPKDDRYPMRGLPYRYERPHDPVTLEDWEILK